MEEKTLSCVDCGTQNCKFKTRTYPEFCLTTNLSEEDSAWALERYDEDIIYMPWLDLPQPYEHVRDEGCGEEKRDSG